MIYGRHQYRDGRLPLSVRKEKCSANLCKKRKKDYQHRKAARKARKQHALLSEDEKIQLDGQASWQDELYLYKSGNWTCLFHCHSSRKNECGKGLCYAEGLQGIFRNRVSSLSYSMFHVSSRNHIFYYIWEKPGLISTSFSGTFSERFCSVLCNANLDGFQWQLASEVCIQMSGRNSMLFVPNLIFSMWSHLSQFCSCWNPAVQGSFR